ncbi:hypothetical protein CVT25_003714 [Psilocybe cyanescens]|uniref:Uncharacterized protein n=1 Tax=Psilocybe cyanescens TaxID=93625 RepID=A0A409WXB9_PSICY|nr:hypothetical protein CVT25_003714 [Psilocybe cyanescens]
MFLPHDDPLNSLAVLSPPPGYVPLSPPSESEIVSMPDYFLPGSVVASKGTEITRVSETPLHLEFDSSEPEAAFLVLPEGASRQDMVSTRMTDYLQRHAFNWIRYFEYSGGKHIVPNGNLYIVTGHDKARMCHMAAFPARMATGSRKMSAKYMDGKLYCSQNTTESPMDPPDPVEKEECVFLRGIRLSLNSADWDRHFQSLPQSLTPASILLYTPALSDQLEFIPPSHSDESVSDRSHNNATTVDSRGRDNAHADNQVNEDANNFVSANARTSISEQSRDDSFSDDSIVPEPPKSLEHYSFHPSDIVAQLMLNECPKAKLAFVDDYFWSVLSGQNDRETTQAPLTHPCTQGGFVSDFGILLEEVFKFYDIVEKDGVATIVCKTNRQDSWFVNLLRRFWPKQSREAHQWAADIVADLVRQGEDSLGDEKHVLHA